MNVSARHLSFLRVFIVVTSTYNPLPCYYISAIIYLALNIILGKGLNIFEGRLRKSER